MLDCAKIGFGEEGERGDQSAAAGLRRPTRSIAANGRYEVRARNRDAEGRRAGGIQAITGISAGVGRGGVGALFGNYTEITWRL